METDHSAPSTHLLPRSVANTLNACMHAKSLRSYLTLCDPVDCSLPRLLCPWDFPGKNIGVGCHFLLQEIFLSQESNRRLLRLLHCRQILYRSTFIGHWHLVCMTSVNSHNRPEFTTRTVTIHTCEVTEAQITLGPWLRPQKLGREIKPRSIM